MASKWAPDDPDHFIQRYLAGESPDQLAREHGLSRTPILRFLREQGVELRGRADANRLLAAERSPDERRRYAEAANKARRGRKDTYERLCRRAATREARQTHVSAEELLLREWLTDFGIQSTPQKAIGKYNLDLAVGSVAVEIFGGGWHKTNHPLPVLQERFRYLLDENWTPLIIWIDRRRFPLRFDVVEHVIALYESTGSDPSTRGQYWVVRGNGECLTARGPDLDDLTVIPSPGSG